eukprot:m.114794 g.114794  ORF g.114794 m.114794 type:complete len:70 (+) comp14179_c1_seq2:632-841(+)
MHTLEIVTKADRSRQRSRQELLKKIKTAVHYYFLRHKKGNAVITCLGEIKRISSKKNCDLVLWILKNNN